MTQTLLDSSRDVSAAARDLERPAVGDRALARRPDNEPHLDNDADNAVGLLHGGFLASARRYPTATALVVAGREWTYAELEDAARRWAATMLRACGTRPRRVGVFAYRSETAYIGVLAALFAGATFVPLNRTFPPQRTRRMIELAELDALIVDRGSLPQLAEILEGLERVPACLVLADDEPDAAPSLGVAVRGRLDLQCAEPLQTLPVAAPDDVAYLLFTSGSTGQPKGVPITHANVVHFLAVNQRRYQLTPADRLSQTFDQTFDLSVFDLFMAWGSGAAVCAMQPIHLLAPFRFVRENRITVWFSVPSVAALLRKKNLLKPDSLPSLRWSLFCGEALPGATAEAWQDAAPNSLVENLYGPTELTIACTVYRWDPTYSPAECVNGMVPIGMPYEKLDAIVADEALQPVPTGAEGELCVAGPQTFQGYWRDPAKTAERTFQRPTATGGLATYYRTGDRVRYLPSGNLAYLGRVDHQVKVNGYRVELSEIEGVLAQQSGVVSAVALGWPVEEGTAQGIVAFVLGPGVDLDTLVDASREQLPSYMVPRAICAVDAMPLNANGKIDRKELLRRLADGELQDNSAWRAA